MTRTQFEVARAYYEQVLKQQVEEDVPAASPPPSGPASTSAPSEGTRLDAEVDAREALVREGVEVGLPEVECRHIVTMHKDLAKAREILTQAARRRMQVA